MPAIQSMLRLVSLLTLSSLTACRTAAPALGGNAGTGAVRVVRVYDARESRWVPFETMMRSVAAADVVFLGEQHDDPVTHGVELAVLAALGERRGRVVLSLEMFERDVQGTLDRYLAGTMPEADFLAASRPWERYATDYRPLVELARVRGWPVVAANVPRPIASAVSRRGLAHLDSLSALMRGFTAAEHQCPRDPYFERFAATMSGHGAGVPGASADAGAGAVIERFYEAQCVKDEAMGEAVATAYASEATADTRAPVLHVDGAFHSDYGLGTVERARRRIRNAKFVVLSAVPVVELAAADVAPHREKGDYIVFTLATAKGP
ncbi:MAG TPA: ChaN family lipoprotein [Gemmatimonas sp.]|nr:ChaN family lipoprotein [Gemmatimonas sp.]